MCFRVGGMKKSSVMIAIIVVAVILLGATSSSFAATNPIPSPREQADSGISAANVVCKPGLKLIIRSSSDSAACVKSTSYEKILQYGWAKTVAELLDKKPQLSNVGDVKTLKIIPLFFDTGIRESKPEIVTSYNYVFEACSKTNLLRSPEILVVSDSETKTVILSENIPAKSCQTSATVIRASNTDTIKASIIKKTDISIIISELETKVSSLQETLTKEKKDLASLARQDPAPSDLTKMISQKTDNIIDLRNQLNIARADLQKNQYALIVGLTPPPKIESKQMNKEVVPPEVSPNKVPHVNKIKTAAQFVDSGRLKSDPLTSSYNFVFEACAGENDILYPEVMIRSDTEVKSVKISEPLDAFTCQTSSTTIKAADQNSIQGVMITAGDVSNSIKDLESKIVSLQASISQNKQTLGSLVKQSPPPDDLVKQVSELTDKIINQRNDLNKAKQELISLKYMVTE